MAEKKKVAKKVVKKAVVKEALTPRPKPKPIVQLKTMPAGNFDEVASLLEHARKCHLAAKVYARGEARPQGFKAHWQTACDARKRAHELDPGHLAPAWKFDEGFAGKDTHSTLMVFYGSVGCV